MCAQHKKQEHKNFCVLLGVQFWFAEAAEAIRAQESRIQNLYVRLVLSWWFNTSLGEGGSSSIKCAARYLVRLDTNKIQRAAEALRAQNKKQKDKTFVCLADVRLWFAEAAEAVRAQEARRQNLYVRLLSG